VRLVEEHVLISFQTKYDMIPYVQLLLEAFYKCSPFDHPILTLRIPPHKFSVLQFFYFIFQCVLTLSKSFLGVLAFFYLCKVLFV
jgi:hypothetical protein